MSLTKSQWVLILASLVTAVLTWQASKQEVATAASLPTRVLSANTLQATQQQSDVQLVLPVRKLVPLQSDLFAQPYLAPPPARQAHSQALAKPKLIAPPLPFKYVGRWQDVDKSAVMIDYQGEIIPIKQGDTVAGQYQVVAINDTPFGLQIQFRLTSLNQIQTMQVEATP